MCVCVCVCVRERERESALVTSFPGFARSVFFGGGGSSSSSSSSMEICGEDVRTVTVAACNKGHEILISR